MLVIAHLMLAAALFFLVNWVGKHAVDFGYGSTTLFDESNESLALNFFVRAFAPAVFIVALSAAIVSAGRPDLRFGIFLIAIYYYALRAVYIFAVEQQSLISWPKFLLHAIVGVSVAFLAYRHLIIPNRSLVPNLDQAGNELWLAILAFLYATANKVILPNGARARRRNRFVKQKFDRARHEFGEIIDRKIRDRRLQLIAYAILVYESYCRPPLVRRVERLMCWKKKRTTGIMQVSASGALSDRESVDLGLAKLLAAWKRYARGKDGTYSRVYRTITDYNYDADYADKVIAVMEVIAKRTAPEFRASYNDIYSE